MSELKRVSLEASRATIAAGTRMPTDPPPSSRIEVTVLVRRRPDSGGQARVDAVLEGHAPPLSREEFAMTLGAEPADLAQVEEFARSYGLQVLEMNAARRVLRAAGTVAQIETAFGTKLHTCGSEGATHICYEGALTIPASLEGIVEAVLGLDQRPVDRR